MKQDLVFVGLVTFIVTISCDFFTKNISNSQTRHSYDTIRFNYHGDYKADDDTCFGSIEKFSEKFGIVISDYYLVKDSLLIDLNNDNCMDMIVVLSPLSLEPGLKSCNFSFDSRPKRILVVIINKNGKASVRDVYSNIISDAGGVLSHYSGVFRTKNGFKIVHAAGARYSWQYSMEITVYKDFLSLTKISKTCSFEGVNKNVDFYYHNIALEKVNFSDTLAHQCNCEKYWSQLEKR